MSDIRYPTVAIDMKKRIFLSVMISVLLSLFISVSLIFVYAHYISEKDFMPEIKETVVPIAISALLSFALSALVSWGFTRSIASDINSVNLDDPQSLKGYPELSPLVEKISKQSYKLSRKRSELKMRESEFDKIALNMSEGMIIINSRANVLSMNKSARDIFGMEQELPASVFAIDRGDKFRETVTSALMGKTAYCMLKIGEKSYSLIATHFSHEGRVEGAVVIVIDITESEEREKLRREFTANVSHELKTPLTTISGFAELIEGGMAEGEDAKKFAGKIHKEANRLVGLVGDIIRLSELDSGEIVYDGDIDLYAVAEAAKDRLVDFANSKNVTLSLSGKHAYVKGNMRILEEMIGNLTDNAVKYNKDGGTVELKVAERGENVLFTVKDSGIGIPQDKKERVFERFYRVDKSHSRESGGTGLGLSIVKHAATYHGAEISIESELQKGTEIKITFPKSK